MKWTCLSCVKTTNHIWALHFINSMLLTFQNYPQKWCATETWDSHHKLPSWATNYSVVFSFTTVLHGICLHIKFCNTLNLIILIDLINFFVHKWIWVTFVHEKYIMSILYFTPFFCFHSFVLVYFFIFLLSHSIPPWCVCTLLFFVISGQFIQLMASLPFSLTWKLRKCIVTLLNLNRIEQNG